MFQQTERPASNGALFCDIAKPIEYASTIDADHVTERLPYLQRQIVGHNIDGKEECGWR